MAINMYNQDHPRHMWDMVKIMWVYFLIPSTIFQMSGFCEISILNGLYDSSQCNDVTAASPCMYLLAAAVIHAKICIFQHDKLK